jgi:dethiobiotin synthetase
MKPLFVTGTDTDVGKTVFASLLVRYQRMAGTNVAALKPICSGGRDDARALEAALGGALALEEINPWHFRAAMAPLLAACREKRRVTLAQVKDHAREIQKKFPALVIEGAGGLLSPLGENFDSRDLIVALRAIPIVVCPNRLGAINQVLLTLDALPKKFFDAAHVVLMAPRKFSMIESGNAAYLGEVLGRSRVHLFPWLNSPNNPKRAFSDKRVKKVFDSMLPSVQT